mmetsp:Transcript_28124/g.61769  ORF Transcript_28124/g.61769 Transcript_28124/m.61769 type:complete len:132 (-) Transcript_28124:228-623(-)
MSNSRDPNLKSGSKISPLYLCIHTCTTILSTFSSGRRKHIYRHFVILVAPSKYIYRHSVILVAPSSPIYSFHWPHHCCTSMLCMPSRAGSCSSYSNIKRYSIGPVRSSLGAALPRHWQRGIVVATSTPSRR